MTIPITDRKNGPYLTNGVTTDFPYTFRIEADAELEVWKLDTSAGTATLLTLTSDYTVTGAGGASGGNVVILPALGSGFEITIIGAVDQSQETDYENQVAYHPDVIEDSLDKLTKMIIELQGQLDRSLKVNVTDDNPEVEFAPDQQADTFVKRLANGDFVLTEFTTGVMTGNTAYGTTLNRPTGLGASDAMKYTYFDTDLGYPIFWNGADWSNYSGYSGV